MVADASAVAKRILSRVNDPEIPVLSVLELGIVRDITAQQDSVEVMVSPTYSGCPATQIIEDRIEQALRQRFSHVTVTRQLDPPWTTDWITEAGHEKMLKAGIAPPSKTIHCPQCGSKHVTMTAPFGSTACKSLYKCEDCLEPFEHFRCLR